MCYARVVLLLMLLAGCSANVDSAAPPTAVDSAVTPTANPLISREAAIERAIQNTAQSRPELSGAKIAPQNIQAEQMTLADATQRYFADGGINVNYDPATPVWVVTLDGIWLDEFPRPTELPAPAPYRHVVIVLNARTSEEMAMSARP